GSGSVTIDANLIQGNNAGAGDGGGIAIQASNGADVALAPDNPDRWHAIDVTNNIIANNVAGLAGGGIGLQEAAVVNIVNNTIVRNDSTATAGAAFAPDNPNLSTAQPAGIVSRVHSAPLAAAFGASALVAPYAEVSNPVLVNDILWQNRSFSFYITNGATAPFGLTPDPSTPSFWDLAVLGTASPVSLNPMNCVLTDAAGYDASNIATDPMFVSQYYNGNRNAIFIQQEFTTAIDVAAAFDEGGNFLDIRYGPLSLINPATGLPFGDYHLQAASPARDIGQLNVSESLPTLGEDFDQELRPNGGVDAGADELYAVGVTNGAPFAADDRFNVRTALLVRLRFIGAPGVLTNDVDPEGDPMTAVLVNGVSHGTLTLFPNGSFLYRPNRFFTGMDSFTYKASDGINTGNLATVTLSVSWGGNDRPHANQDAYSTLPDTVLDVPAPGILANDENVDGGTLQAIQIFWPGNGTLDLRPNGSFTYTPDPGFIGQDTFRYAAYDGAVSNIVRVTIDVSAPVPLENLPPTPAATAIATVMDTPGVTRIMPRDPNTFDTFVYAVTTAPLHGSLVLTATGILNYTPNPGYLGADSVTVSVTDQGGLSASVTIDIAVTEMPPMVMSDIKLQCPPDTDGIDTDGDGIVDNDNVCIHLGAGDGFVRMADGKVMYMFGFGDLTNTPVDMTMHEGMLAAEFPAPTIALKEGQRVYLNLTNVGMMMRPDLFDPHTVHFHGFPQAAPVFDGNPEASFGVNMGATVTYFYELVEPGTFMYHCHMEATEHMQMGMLGNLYVTPKQNGQSFEYPAGSGRTYTKFAYNDGNGSTGYDVESALQLGGFDPSFHDASLSIQPLPFALMDDKYPMINGRGYPDTVNPAAMPAPDENGNKPSQKVTSLVTATQGQRILLRISSLCVTRVFTLASMLPMEIVGDNARMLRNRYTGEELFYTTNSVTLGGGESVDAIIDTAGVPAGTYLLYTTNLNYLSNNEEDFGGMMTEIVISE
ncbi:MAG: hypothetical protein QG656_1831, partial [Candidatus Hydrogenedentes bacterium]|nr:hypothetical protein [Candidatus Hydrogenedentota bacterium]